MALWVKIGNVYSWNSTCGVNIVDFLVQVQILVEVYNIVLLRKIWRSQIVLNGVLIESIVMGLAKGMSCNIGHKHDFIWIHMEMM